MKHHTKAHLAIEPLEQRLAALNEEGQRRTLAFRKGIDFSSNDYLGFSADAELRARVLQEAQLRELPLGSSGSRLLRGQLEFFEEVETLLAQFCSREAAVVFPSGYQANVALLSALLRPTDIVFSDALNHASLIDGIRLSGARKEIYRHADVSHLRDLLSTSLKASSSSESLRIILTESLFGMDGDLAPLQELADLAEEFDALLIVDEAHATGLWGQLQENNPKGGGPKGGGIIQALGLSNRVFATIHPAGKAMGVSGAWVCGDAQLKDYLINFSRGFIFSTAPSPFIFLLLKSAVEYWKEVGPLRAQAVLERARYFNQPGPIVPILLGDNHRAMEAALHLQAMRYDVRAIRPPTVPTGTARLRITLHWHHPWDELEGLKNEIRNLCHRNKH